jgi:uncharacterized membrane protein YccC
VIRTGAAAVRAAVPDWLAEVVRPKPAPVPWPEMARAALAICVPLAVGLALGKVRLGVLPAMGGILGTMVDRGGPYLTRVKRVSSAAVFGGAVGLTIGSATHGGGWIAVVALILVAGASGVLSALGAIGSVTGLQLLIYTALGAGPLGAQHPVWHTAVGFLAGVVWALVLILPGWLLSPRGREQRDAAAVYTALAEKMRSVGTDRFTAARQAVTAALNIAYDELITGRSTAVGRDPRASRLLAALNASVLMAQATTALGVAGIRPPPLAAETTERLAESVRRGTRPPVIPPAWDDSPGALALHDAMVAAARAISGEEPEADAGETARRGVRRGPRKWSVRERMAQLEEKFGRVNQIFTLRLMACMGVAGVVSEVLPLQRSYWVELTVAIVLKPDFGSVFARALQRAIGTVVGAVLGAVLLALVHGTWLLVPLAVLAALLPFGRSRNYGLLSVFLTPLVVILVDLLIPAGWRLAEDRLVDTLVGCAIVLLIGYAPWPMSWHAHLPGQFAEATLDVGEYIEAALLGTAPPEGRTRMRRSTYRALADLRAEFQRTMSEPLSVSRRASAWWPAVVGLEQVMDASAITALTVSGGASVPHTGVRQLSAALRAISEAASQGTPRAGPPALPDDETLKPVTEAVRELLGVLGAGDRLAGGG